jgi:hypothetical protein
MNRSRWLRPRPAALSTRTPAIFGLAMKFPANGFNVYEFDVVSEGGRK